MTTTKTLQELEAERLAWSLVTFKEATPISSLRKLEGEIKEVEQLLTDPLNAPPDVFFQNLTEEYADCLMCLFDSAGRAGITVHQITQAFASKLEKNKARVWRKNPDNSYSHVKAEEPSSPTTLEEAVTYLLPRFKDAISWPEYHQSEDAFAAMCHSVTMGGIGMQIRNELKLWQPETPLHQYFLTHHNLFHADDMSDLIIRGVYQKLKADY